jgi:flagellin
MSSINAQNILKFKNAEVSKDMEKLSSGMKINRAADDASGLAVSEKMRSQIRGLLQAERNIENGASFIQTTEGYLKETGDIVQRMRELAIQSSNGIYSPEDRMQVQVEVSQLVDEVDRIASHAQFNGMNMLTGSFANGAQGGAPTASMWLHVGANMNQREQIFIGTMTAGALGLVDAAATKLSLSTPESANQAIGTLDQALTKINKQRADLGAYQNRFEVAQQGISIAAENLTAAESVIRDSNMADQMVKYVTNNILTQSSTAMLAQANQRANSVLQLLG